MENDDELSTAALMRGPLAGFTAARTAVVRELKQQGNHDLAAVIGALRKPSLTLWALNQAGVVAAAELDELRSVAGRLQATQRRLLEGDPSAASEIRTAQREHREALDVLTRRLGMAVTAAGHPASPETVRRISEGLRRASLAGDETWMALRDGRLTTEPEPESFPVTDSPARAQVIEPRAAEAAPTTQPTVAPRVEPPFQLRANGARFARPTTRLAECTAFYSEVLGLTVLANFHDHDGYSGVIFGLPHSAAQLELTQRAGQRVAAPTGDHQLVLYFGGARDLARAVTRLRERGVVEVSPDNPYWERRGATAFADPDGWLVILCPGGADS